MSGVNQSRCHVVQTGKAIQLLIPGMPDCEVEIPIEILNYRNCEDDPWKRVGLVFLWSPDLQDAYLTRLQAEAHCATPEMSVPASRTLACWIWVRLHYRHTRQRQFFKAVDWGAFLRDSSWQIGLTHSRPVRAMEEIGESVCRSRGIPSGDQLRCRLHFSGAPRNLGELKVARDFLAAKAEEIIAAQDQVLGEAEFSSEVPFEGNRRAKADNRIRSLLKPLRTEFQSKVGSLDALHVEALIEHIEGTNDFYESLLSQIEGGLGPLEKALFRFFHLAGPRPTDSVGVPVPVVHSETLASAIRLAAGDLEGLPPSFLKDIPPDERMVAPELLSIMEAGGQIEDERQRRVMHRVVGFVEAYRIHLHERRIEATQRQKRYRQGRRPPEAEPVPTSHIEFEDVHADLLDVHRHASRDE